MQFLQKENKNYKHKIEQYLWSNIVKKTRFSSKYSHAILIQKKKKIKVWNFSPKRDFIHTDDVADAVINLLFSNYSGNINLGTGISNSVGSVCKIISKLT